MSSLTAAKWLTANEQEKGKLIYCEIMHSECFLYLFFQIVILGSSHSTLFYDGTTLKSIVVPYPGYPRWGVVLGAIWNGLLFRRRQNDDGNQQGHDEDDTERQRGPFFPAHVVEAGLEPASVIAINGLTPIQRRGTGRSLVGGLEAHL